AMAVKDTVFRYYQPAMVLAILAFWGLGPVAWTGNVTTLLIAGILTKVSNLALEFVNERHASWRLTWREWLTDLFYVGLGYTVLRYAHKHWG
ncbi:hypothetical protein, partial [Enterococcus faecalis]|uniref:hypothetical protein n=1 Tax=Enterococcus faecalis TaxID=1351 RepID=UPI00403F3D1D